MCQTVIGRPINIYLIDILPNVIKTHKEFTILCFCRTGADCELKEQSTELWNGNHRWIEQLEHTIERVANYCTNDLQIAKLTKTKQWKPKREQRVGQSVECKRVEFDGSKLLLAFGSHWHSVLDYGSATHTNHIPNTCLPETRLRWLNSVITIFKHKITANEIFWSFNWNYSYYRCFVINFEWVA